MPKVRKTPSIDKSSSGRDAGGAIWLRLARALALTAPILMFGFWLGMGRWEEKPKTRPVPFVTMSTQPVLNVPGAETYKTDEAKIFSQIAKGGGMELTGGKNWRARMEIAQPPRDRAISKYMSMCEKEGWSPAKDLTKSFASLGKGSEMLAYRKKGGNLRLVIIGEEPVTKGGSIPVTVFDGIFADR